MTAESKPIALRARFVFPVAGSPIAGGAVTIRGSKIIAVVGAGRRQYLCATWATSRLFPG